MLAKLLSARRLFEKRVRLALAVVLAMTGVSGAEVESTRGGITGGAPIARTQGATDAPWRFVSPGLEVGEFVSPVRSQVGDSVIVVVRVDPRRYTFKLLCAKTLGLTRNPTAREWVEGHGLVGAINASMYRGDHRTAVAYMQDGTTVNNSCWTKDNSVFAAEPSDPTLPEVQIVDRTCQDLDALRGRYRILVQSIRMLTCARQNAWARQPRRWSTACLGMDTAGHVLLIHSRSPYATHDLIEALRKLPLALERLMYVEGGPEASIYVKVGGQVVASRVGSFETGFLEADTNTEFWPIPNVIGFAEKQSP